MAENDLQLVNRDGRIVAEDPETGETQPVSIGSLETENTHDALNGRDLWSQVDELRTVSVDPSGGADYTSVQDAIDDNVAYFENGHVRINLADATYDEDVVIKGGTGPTWSDESSLDTVFSVRIVGNETTPSNVNGLSVASDGFQGMVDLAGLHIDRESPVQAENAGVVALKSQHVALRDCEFGDLDTGVFSYSSYVEISNIDFGTDLTNATATKHGGVVYNEDGASDDNLSGTTTGPTHEVDNGQLNINPKASLSSSGDSALYEINNGLVIENGRGVISEGAQFTRLSADGIQEIANDQLEKVAWDTVEDNSLDGANLSNNEIVIEKTSGVFRVKSAIRPRQTLDQMTVQIRVNGSREFEGYSGDDGIGAFETFEISDTMALGVGDSVSVHVSGVDPSGNPIDLNGFSGNSRFTVIQS